MEHSYEERCRENEKEVAAMWRTFIKWGGVPGLIFVGFCAALGEAFGGLVLVLLVLSPWLIGLFAGTLCQALFPGWRGLLR